MQIERITRQKNQNYTTLCNVALRDPRLSLKAKGFFAIIMSLPPTWDFSIKGIQAILVEGRHTVYTVIGELEKLGYVKRERIYENGRVAEWRYVFNEVPTVENKDVDLLTENLEVEILEIEKLELENRPQLSTKEIKDLIEEEASDADVSPPLRTDSTSKEKKVVRGSRLGETFLVLPSNLAKLEEEFPTYDLSAITKDFIDHWLSASGRSAVKVDWQAAWRRWVRNEMRPKLKTKELNPVDYDVLEAKYIEEMMRGH
jgi:predicted transcriptional regulator